MLKWFISSKRISEGWLCPTEKLLVKVGLYNLLFIFFIGLLGLVIPFTLNFIIDFKEYISYSIPVSIGLLMVSNLLYGFKHYGDLIYEVANVLGSIGGEKIKKEILTAVYSNKRFISAVVFAFFVSSVILLFIKINIFFYILYVIGGLLIGFLGGDAILGTIMYPLVVGKKFYQLREQKYEILYHIDQLKIIAVTGLSLMVNGVVLLILIIAGIHYVFVFLFTKINYSVAFLLEIIALIIATPSLLLLFYYPLYSIKRTADLEKKAILNALSNKEREIISNLKKLVFNLKDSEDEWDKIDNETVTSYVTVLNAIHALKEYYKSLSPWPVTLGTVAKSIVLSFIPWLSSISEIQTLMNSILTFLLH